MIEASLWGSAAGVAPQYGPTVSPRQHRYAPTFEPEPRFPWLDQALCREVDPEIFYPEKGGSTKEAKRVCGECAVAGLCLSDALDRKEMHGIRGGLSAEERKKLIKGKRDEGKAA